MDAQISVRNIKKWFVVLTAVVMLVIAMTRAGVMSWTKNRETNWPHFLYSINRITIESSHYDLCNCYFSEKNAIKLRQWTYRIRNLEDGVQIGKQPIPNFTLQKCLQGCPTMQAGPSERNWYWGAASEASWNGGPGACPLGKFLRPRPLDHWKTPLLYKLHYSNDEEMTIFRCLIDEEHHLQNF